MEASKYKANEPANEPVEPKPKNTRKPEVAALIDLHKKLVDKAPIETEDDLFEVTAAMLQTIQTKLEAKIAPKDSNNQPAVPVTEHDVFFQEVAAELSQLGNMIDARTTATANEENIPTSAPEASKAQLEPITNTPPVDLENVDDNPPKNADDNPPKNADDDLPKNADDDPPENADEDPTKSAEPQPEEATEKEPAKATDPKERRKAKNDEKRARKKAKLAKEKANAPAAEITAAQAAALPIGRNPNFTAEVRGSPDDLNAKVLADITRCKQEGDMGKLCVVCSKRTESGCNGCNRAARYCSRECQVLDFPLHTKVCSDFAGPAAEEKRPSPQHHRVLFFPAFKVKPEICWATFRGADTHCGWVEFDHEDIDQFYKAIGVRRRQRGSGQIHTDPTEVLDGRPIGHSFMIISLVGSDLTFNKIEPRVLNQSINALTKPGYLRPWFGPVMFAADSSNRYPGQPAPPILQDINPRDVHSITRFLERCDGLCITNPKLYYGETISGLLINNPLDGINAVMGVGDAFHLTDVPLAPLDYSDSPIALAFFLGLRWYIRSCYIGRLGIEKMAQPHARLRYTRYIYDIIAKVDNGGDEDDGQAKTSLPEGKPALVPRGYPPSVIILHGSGKPVEPLHLSAFNDFFDEVFKENKKKEEVSKKKFLGFWAKYKQSQGSGAFNFPSPYKWENDNSIDRLGFYDPTFVGNIVREQIGDVWDEIAAGVEMAAL